MKFVKEGVLLTPEEYHKYQRMEACINELQSEFEDDIYLQQKWENMHAEEELETLSAIEDYMNSNCQNCIFGKGSQQCENCYVGGY